MNMKIKWTNKWSGDKGFVKSINTKEQYFENTADETEAKTFSKRTIKKTLQKLESYCDWNNYEVVTTD